MTLTWLSKLTSEMTIENWIDSLLAVVAGGSMIVTAIMATKTRDLAVYTKSLVDGTTETISQGERHHRETLRPLCVTTFPTNGPGSFLGITQTTYTENGRDFPGVQVSGTLTNKGLGPAIEIYFYIIDGGGYRLTYPIFLQEALAPAEQHPIDCIIKPRTLIGTFHTDGRGDAWRADFGPEFILQNGYYLIISYKDVFSTEFSTIYARGQPQNIEEDIKAVTDPEIRRKQRNRLHYPAPIFRTGPQFPNAYDERTL